MTVEHEAQAVEAAAGDCPHVRLVLEGPDVVTGSWRCEQCASSWPAECRTRSMLRRDLKRDAIASQIAAARSAVNDAKARSAAQGAPGAPETPAPDGPPAKPTSDLRTPP